MYPHAVRRGGTEGNIILYIGKSGRTKKLPGDLYASYPQTGDLNWWTPLDRYKETGEKKGGGVEGGRGRNFGGEEAETVARYCTAYSGGCNSRGRRPRG